MTRLSHGVALAWATAALEAQSAGSESIEPEHFFLSLCKMCDASFDNAFKHGTQEVHQIMLVVKQEACQLSQVFASAHTDTTKARRELRGLLGPFADEPISSRMLHRSLVSRAIFKRAEILSISGGSQLKPLHLLVALMESNDQRWNDLLNRLQLEPLKIADVARDIIGCEGGRIQEIDPNRRQEKNSRFDRLPSSLAGI